MLGLLRVYRERDPASRSLLEALLFSHGLHALVLHRIAHSLLRSGLRIPARGVAYVSRILTGVEIHPGAEVGRRLFIDHGAGIVIGETAIVGDDVSIFHGVTLGSARVGAGAVGRRHPVIGDRVVLGAHASVLGPVRIGSDSRVGAGALVMRNVPQRCLVVAPRADVHSLVARALPVTADFHI